MNRIELGLKRKTADYTVEDYAVLVPVDDYISRFRDADKFMQCCRECGNYNKSWACPPFSHDLESMMRNYRSVLLYATKITPHNREIPLSEATRFIRNERIRLERMLLDMEKAYGGRSFAYAGTCLYCPEGTCTRLQGRQCRHPELVRPSLEAFGFDIGRTTSELFGIELVWSKDQFLPEYMTLVCGFFHNCDAGLKELLNPKKTV